MTTEAAVLEFVKTLIDELKDYEDEITFDTTLQALDLDSLDYVQTQIEVKKLFGVGLSAELFVSGQIATVGDLCRYVANPPAAPAAPAVVATAAAEPQAVSSD